MILRSIGGNADKVLEELESQLGDNHIYVWGGYNHYQDWAIDVFSKAILEKKIVCCAETPLIGRSLFDANDINSYYRIALDTVSTQQNRNFNLPIAAEPDRLYSILDNTSTSLEPWRKDGEHILYAMQVPADSSLRGLDIFAAAQYDLFQIRQITSRPIRVSLHPDLRKDWGMSNFKENNRHFDRFMKVAEMVGAQVQIGETRKALEGCWCVVCYTSGFGFESLAAGIPVITLNAGNFVAPLCSQTLYDINNPYTAKENEKIYWLSRVAYCQWNMNEIKSGKVRQHFSSLLLS